MTSSLLPPPACASLFHPAVAAWFEPSFAAPTAAQAEAWPRDQGRPPRADRGADRLRQDARRVPGGDRRPGAPGPRGRARGRDAVVYVSPLKALSNDIQRNLEEPLAGIRDELAGAGLPDVEIRTSVRTGDTPPASASACAAGRRTSWSPRRSRSTSCSARSPAARMLATTRTVIVDEIHAVAPEQARHAPGAVARAARGARAATACCASASRRRRSRSRRWRASWSAPAGGRTAPDCTIIDTGHRRAPRPRARGARLAARSGDVGARSGSRSTTASPS